MLEEMSGGDSRSNSRARHLLKKKAWRLERWEGISMGERYQNAREKMKLASASETKLSNECVQLEKENTSEAKRRKEEKLPPVTKWPMTGQWRQPGAVRLHREERRGEEKTDCFSDRQERTSHRTRMTWVSITADSCLDSLEQGSNNEEPKSRGTQPSSMAGNGRHEPVAKKAETAGGTQDCLLFRKTDTAETGQEQLQQRADNALRRRGAGSFSTELFQSQLIKRYISFELALGVFDQ